MYCTLLYANITPFFVEGKYHEEKKRAIKKMGVVGVFVCSASTRVTFSLLVFIKISQDIEKQ